MKIKILAFGVVAEITGPELEIETEITTSEQALSILEAKYPSLREVKFSIALNKSIIRQETELMDGDVIALLPPFSGG